jgi:predicted Zn-dependent protease
MALVVLASGCAVNPVSGRPEFTLVSEAGEREMGEEEARNVAAQMGLYDEPALVAYVRTVGQRLVDASPLLDLAYEFHIVDMVEPNAFAIPGGYIYVSRGILALTNDEDELAGILAHEIGHVAARHSVRTISRAAPLAVVTGLGAAVTGIVSPMLGSIVGGLGGLAGALVFAPYSRSQEEEADRVGQEMAAKAGFDPAGISRSLHTLEREDTLHGNAPREMSFFSTHPPLPRRVAMTTERAQGLARGKASPPIDTPERFLEHLQGSPSARASTACSMAAVPAPGAQLRPLPAGWKTTNAAAVGAVAPDKSGAAPELAQASGSLEAAMRQLGQQTRMDLARGAERLTNGLPAVRDCRRPAPGTASPSPWIAFAAGIVSRDGHDAPGVDRHASPSFQQTAAGSARSRRARGHQGDAHRWRGPAAAALSALRRRRARVEAGLRGGSERARDGPGCGRAGGQGGGADAGVPGRPRSPLELRSVPQHPPAIADSGDTCTRGSGSGRRP